MKPDPEKHASNDNDQNLSGAIPSEPPPAARLTARRSRRRMFDLAAAFLRAGAGAVPPPPLLPSVLTGHASSLLPY